MMAAGQDDDLEQGILPGCALEYFSEHKEILELIQTIDSVCENQAQFETCLQKFQFIVDQYREQVHLLDSHLDEILDEIILRVRSVDAPMNLKHKLFKYLYMIVNVRGYKVIVKKLPHEVSDLKPILTMLEEQDKDDLGNWHTRYCLLLWLSIIVKIPFDMARFDCGDVGDSTIMNRILNICHTYVLSTDACNKMAAHLVSQFITRTDVKQIHLKPFLHWCTRYFIGETSAEAFVKFGPLSALASILKFGKREDLRPHSETLLRTLVDANIHHDTYRLTRWYYVKLIQRLGLTFLKVQIAPWRYKRGNRILSVSTNDKKETRTQDPSTDEDAKAADEDFDVPPQVEEVINELFETLRDKDMTVRWSAAKGLGRITNRLPKSLADDVIGTVMDCLSPREKDPAWHGACLALAELGKRGLLLPHRLPAAVSCILKALVYDEPKGFCSVGSYIRDAACYVCWAFARAYDQSTLEPLVQDIARGLLVVACYDKEINCRRAASAAFQELVGRQGGSLPHGIDILTRADYFTVGVRASAYTEVSVYVAGFAAYTRAFVQHLVARKVEHWDADIRRLTAKTLPKLVPLDSEYFVSEVLEQLLAKINSIDLNARHGATLSLGEVVRALGELECDIPEDTRVRIQDVVSNYRQKKQLQGLSGEMTREACCYMIEQLCAADCRMYAAEWQVLINECLLNEALSVRTAACDALPVLCRRVYAGDVSGASSQSLISCYVSQLQTSTSVAREGHAMALGVLPPFMLLPHLDLILTGLIQCTRITEDSAKWIFARKYAIEALDAIVRKLAGERALVAYVPELFECYLAGVKDYSIDSRGDIGRFTRQASMAALQGLLVTCVTLEPSTLTQDNVERAVCALLKQAVERIDDTRGLAAQIFYFLLTHQPEIPHIAHRAELLCIFSPDIAASVDWIKENQTFPLFSQVLACDTYTQSLTEGFVLSMGGISERLVKYSVKHFLAFLKTQPRSKLLQVCDIITALFRQHSGEDEYMGAMLLFLDKLLSSYVINNVLEDSNFAFCEEILSLVKAELAGCKSIKKLKAGVEVYCQLLQFSSTRLGALTRLLMYLTNSFAFLRKHCALRLYETLLLLAGDVPEEERALSLLADTDWLDATDKQTRRSVQDELCRIYGVTLPLTKRVEKK